MSQRHPSVSFFFTSYNNSDHGIHDSDISTPPQSSFLTRKRRMTMPYFHGCPFPCTSPKRSRHQRPSRNILWPWWTLAVLLAWTKEGPPNTHSSNPHRGTNSNVSTQKDHVEHATVSSPAGTRSTSRNVFMDHSEHYMCNPQVQRAELDNVPAIMCILSNMYFRCHHLIHDNADWQPSKSRRSFNGHQRHLHCSRWEEWSLFSNQLTGSQHCRHIGSTKGRTYEESLPCRQAGLLQAGAVLATMKASHADLY